ncbi:MAG: MBL fold metallo-hydrolase [Verrucomicrobia bacterium]|nr:MBL fold metallo-hydrolase [Verrucomicrobiota bacterium]
MLIKSPPAEITRDFWMLGTAEYPVFGYRDADECVLFEASVSAVAPVIARQLAALGVGPEAVQQVIVTHAHPDHVMGVPVLRKLFPRLTVLASPVAAKTLGVEKAVAFFCKVDQALAAALQTAGSLSGADQAQPPAEMRIGIDRTIQEGDTVTAGEASFAVLETPGHSECSLSFHEPRRGWLIVSDATGYYLPEHDWWWPNYFASYGANLDSMRRLAELGAEVLCLSHNAVVSGAEHVAAYFARALSATESYHHRIVAEVRGGKSSRALAEELGAEVYAKTQLLGLDFFQKNCALLVKQSLQHEGITEQA